MRLVMATNSLVLLTIVIMSLISFTVRALPFYFLELFKDNKIIQYLAYTLPAAIMLILVVFSIQYVNYLQYPYGMPEIISSLLVAIIHVWKRNIIFSITMGVVCYEALLLLL